MSPGSREEGTKAHFVRLRHQLFTSILRSFQTVSGTEFYELRVACVFWEVALVPVLDHTCSVS